MARTIAQIYDALNQVKNNMNELQNYVTETTGSKMDTATNIALDAKSGSRVAKWRIWLWIVAVASWTIENIVESAQLVISAIINGQRPHTLRWYEEETKNWQYGHELEWLNNDHWGYAQDDEAARLVSQVSATKSGNGEVTIKAVKESGGALAPLATLEKDSLEAYWSKWADAGVEILLVSDDPNQLKIEATVVRDRLILAADGTLLRDSSINPLDLAIAEFIAAIPFNGIIRITDMEAAAKEAEGIKDFVITNLSISPAGDPVWVPVDREVVPSSGFANINTAASTYTNIDE